MNRAYSLITIKRVSDDERTIFGIATTPATDLQDDIVEPRGAVFKLPIPLLWQHKHDQPIGHVTEARVTDAGIEIVAKIAQIPDAGAFKDFVDGAWSAIRAGLVKGLSIGFKGLSQEPIQGTYGTRWKKWFWLELSCVTIAANMEASILNVKRFDFTAGSGKAITRQPWADVDDEIKGAKERIKKLDAEYADAESKLDDPRWHATGKALGTARSNLQKLETKRAEIMAGIYVEPVVAVPQQPEKQAQPTTEAGREYLAAETAAMQEFGLPERSRRFPVTQGEHAVFLKELFAALGRMRSRIEGLEAGIVVGSKFMGVWQKQIAYPAGSLSTHRGSLWHANGYATQGVEPGENPATWTLCSKAGEPPLTQRDTAGKRITGNAKKHGKVEVTTVTRHDAAGRILETRKHVEEQ